MPPPELPEQLFQTLQCITRVLNEQKVDYALIGGLGCAVRGTIRTTRDVDLLLTISQVQIPRLLECLAGEGFRFDLYEAIRQWSHDHLLEMHFGEIRVDWLKAVVPLFQRVLNRARWEDLGDVPVRVADAEGLLILKLIPFRPRDQEDIQGILASNPGTLDLDWVRHEWSNLGELDVRRARQFEEMVKEFYEDGG
ncbi:MAG: nucleotidyltransferase [Planctomycetes bacterium]|nr:nucleotidyltransferase [Planctomycetota bacterium]